MPITPSEATLRLLAQQPWDALIAVAHRRGKYARPLTSRYLGHVETVTTFVSCTADALGLEVSDRVQEHTPNMARGWASDK